jgi:hypothetical protein
VIVVALLLVPACTTDGGETTTSAETPTDPGDDGTGDDAGTDSAAPKKPDGACTVSQCKNASGKCVTASSTACGKDGSACVDCSKSKDGLACVDGACGCSSGGTCPAGDVCDLAAKKCGPSCKDKPCASGCCSAGGACLDGTDTHACGVSGTCTDCSASPDGHSCVAGGACGCNTAADCSTFQACDTTTHKCTSTCSASQPCNGGCCGSSGTCQGGSSKTACGDTGGACTDCSGNPAGTNVCAFTSKGGTCGCQTSTDCPIDNACDTKTHQCTTACTPAAGGALWCNRGCCDPNTSQCAAGSAPAACGDAPAGFVMICTSCAGADEGPACVASRCGCTGPADCPGRTCSGGKCCSAKGASCTKGSQCCSGACAGIGGVLTCQ